MTHSRQPSPQATAEEIVSMRKELRKLKKQARRYETEILRLKERCDGMPTPRVQRIAEENTTMRRQLRIFHALLKSCHDYLSRATRIEWEGDWTEQPPHFLEDIEAALKAPNLPSTPQA